MSLLKGGPKYSWKKACLLIFISILPMTAALFFMQIAFGNQKIVGMIQGGSLPGGFLAECLDLSFDRPTYLRDFSCRGGVEALCSSGLIKKAHIKKLRGGMLYLDYTLRRPVALLGSLPHGAVDEEGVIFCYAPAYCPKNLPIIYIPVGPEPWGEKISFDFSLLDGVVTQVDMLDKREIVLKTRYGDWIRLEKSTQQLPLYYKLRDEVLKEPVIVDLRLPDMAFMRRCGSND